MEKEIHISILDADHSQLQKELTELKQLGIRHIHLDICDTSFTPSISFGIKMINQILKEDFFFDLHLMVNKPSLLISSLDLQNARCITVHYEINDFGICLENLKELRKSKGIDIGLAIKPETQKINEYVLKQIDRLLIMTVEPGFGGQEFKEEIAGKIAYFRTLFNGMIGVDGGINDKTICKASKADYFVVGSYFYKHPNKKEAIRNLKKLASKSDNTVIE